MLLNRFSFIALCGAILLSGCSLGDLVYRPDINQGNFITQKEVDLLKVGLTKEQVQFVMGSPMLSSIYDNDVWYYVFREWPTYEAISQQLYVITFDSQNRVSDIKYSNFGESDLKQMDHQGDLEFVEED